MRPGEFMAGRWGTIDVNDVAAVLVISLFTHQISLPVGGPQSISPSTMAGVTPRSSSVSDHFFRIGVIVIEPDFTSTRTRSPARSFNCCAASRGMRRPRLLPHWKSVLLRRLAGAGAGVECLFFCFFAVGIKMSISKEYP